EAAVWRLSGLRRTGTLVAAWGGRVLAVSLGVGVLAVPYVLGGRPDVVTVAWMALFGALLWAGSGPFLRSVAHERAVERRGLGGRAVAAVRLPNAACLSELDAAGATRAVLLDGAGAPVGYTDAFEAAQVPPKGRATTPLGAVAITLPAGVSVAAGLAG